MLRYVAAFFMRSKMFGMNENYRIENAGPVMTQCETCGGSGVLRGSATVPCAGCDGTGRILGDRCPECRGLEFQVVETDAPCSQCDGNGFLPMNSGE
jgi:hypothetical protein